jgi:hypothetical protein
MNGGEYVFFYEKHCIFNSKEERNSSDILLKKDADGTFKTVIAPSGCGKRTILFFKKKPSDHEWIEGLTLF